MELFIFSWGTLICTVILLQNSSSFSTEQMTMMNMTSVSSAGDNTAITTYPNASGISTLVSDPVISSSTSASLMPSTIIRTVSSTTIATVSGQPDPTQVPKIENKNISISSTITAGPWSANLLNSDSTEYKQRADEITRLLAYLYGGCPGFLVSKISAFSAAVTDTKTDFIIVLSLSGVVNRFNDVVIFLDSGVNQLIDNIGNSNISIAGVNVTKKYLEDIRIVAVTQLINQTISNPCSNVVGICSPCYNCSFVQPKTFSCTLDCDYNLRQACVLLENTGDVWRTACKCQDGYLPVASSCVDRTIIIATSTVIIGVAIIVLVVVIILCCVRSTNANKLLGNDTDKSGSLPSPSVSKRSTGLPIQPSPAEVDGRSSNSVTSFPEEEEEHSEHYYSRNLLHSERRIGGKKVDTDINSPGSVTSEGRASTSGRPETQNSPDGVEAHYAVPKPPVPFRGMRVENIDSGIRSVRPPKSEYAIMSGRSPSNPIKQGLEIPNSEGGIEGPQQQSSEQDSVASLENDAAKDFRARLDLIETNKQFIFRRPTLSNSDSTL